MTAMRVDAKVVMLGKESVGKTSLVERYVHRRFLVGPYQNKQNQTGFKRQEDVFWGNYDLYEIIHMTLGCEVDWDVKRCLILSLEPAPQTIGAAFVAKALNVGDKVITLGIWDTAGSERYEAMSRIYYRGARAAIVCYDLTDSSSFERARFWVKELQSCEEHCKIYLCGTKGDLFETDRSTRQVDYHDVQDFADEIGAHHFETSSKTGKNVDEVFQKVAEDFSSCDLEFMQEEKGVDLGQKKDSYFDNCCRN